MICTFIPSRSLKNLIEASLSPILKTQWRARADRDRGAMMGYKSCC